MTGTPSSSASRKEGASGPAFLSDALHGNVTVLLAAADRCVRANIRRILDEDPEISVVGECAGGLEAIDLIAAFEPQLTILDADMDGVSGFQVVDRVGRSKMPAVVFVSSFENRALGAFEFGATDFILSSDGPARLRTALERAKTEIRSKERSPVEEVPTPPPQTKNARNPRRILIKTSGELIFLKPEEIRWIEADGDYVKFHVQGRFHLIRETMGRLEAKLDPARFVRIHRSVIINIDMAAKLSPTFAGDYNVHLEDGTKLRLGRRYEKHLHEVMRPTF